MRSKNYYKKREPKPDIKYNRIDFGRFINYLMKDGKKTVAEKIFYSALDKIAEMTKENPIEVFERAIKNTSPMQEVISRRIGGANYQIPREVRPSRKFFLATHWIIEAARSRKGKPMAQKLAEEIIAASRNEGAAVKKKQELHKVAEANRAFASLL